MTLAMGLDWLRQVLWLAVTVSTPLILAGLVVGLAVAVLQAATQVNDASLSFVPKAVATVIAIVAAGPWILTQLVDFATRCIQAMGRM